MLRMCMYTQHQNNLVYMKVMAEAGVITLTLFNILVAVSMRPWGYYIGKSLAVIVCMYNYVVSPRRLCPEGSTKWLL